ncbi:hypothetical protein PQR05_29465 [Paraburkholderia sediminicola]|uniref:hypothetical protein n=1 Tax=Paraburkholderia sediminicola TaxID=458836 RepID=UPI0038BAB88E
MKTEAEIKTAIDRETEYSLNALRNGTVSSEALHKIIRDKSETRSNVTLAGMCSALAIYNATEA